ncbi:MAG TPA: flagellar basal body P-ring formation chaperone FlgA [Tepidisphaeraceae bacterium]|jgi:flagella basal body P-ring formation protein FlgA|nr:flagellar basal body P-ring formation chaperone FlgA [Tepidisphaeraceae bacterium]
MNPKPLSNRKKVQFLVALTLLAWATQTLLHQWARAQDVGAPADAATTERFVPNVGGVDGGATLEMKNEATIHGGDIQLRQICRWGSADAKFFGPMAELTVARFQGKSPFQSVSLNDLRQTLHDSGVNLGLVRFAGATACTVTRSDVAYDESAALQQWADARHGKTPAAGPLDNLVKQASHPTGGTLPLMIPPADLAPDASKAKLAAEVPAHTLRDRIIADASVRLKVPVDQLQINFNPADDAALNLSEPQFKFNLEARRVYGLGEVSWEALVVTTAGNKKIPITATARAWQMQVVLVKPVAYRQTIQSDDVVEKRVLVDQLPDDTLLTVNQVVGQECARELKPGTILTAAMVDPAELAKVGQFITVTMASGGIHVKTVGRAMENGTYGQTIKVKNEATDETYEVVLTAAQEGTISPRRAVAHTE